VCLYVYLPIVARQRFGKNVTAVTNTHATIEELLDASFSMWPVSYQGMSAISSSHNFLLFHVSFIFLLVSLLFCLCSWSSIEKKMDESERIWKEATVA
jgi:hypothetical protein